MREELNKPQPKKLGWFRHYVLMQDISPDPKIRQIRWSFWTLTIVIFIFVILQFVPSLFMKQYFADGRYLKIAEGKIHMIQIGSNNGRKYYNPVIYVNNEPIGIQSSWQCGNYSNTDKLPDGLLVRAWYMDDAIYQMEDVNTGEKFKKFCTIDNFVQITQKSSSQYITMFCLLSILTILYGLKFNKLIRQIGNEGVTPQNQPIRIKMFWIIFSYPIISVIVFLYFCDDLFSISNFMR